MGNTELKQMVQQTPLLRDEMNSFKARFKTFGSALEVDRSAFASLFDPTYISYQVVDRLFDALEKDANGLLKVQELALALILCDRSPMEDKLRFLFNVFDENGNRSVTRRELQVNISRAVAANVRRFRGPGGAFPDRECAGCKRLPDKVVYCCVDCCTGFIMGIPVTVNLCGNCARSWEGVLEENNSRHYLSHKLTKVEAAEGASGSHFGVQCDGCEALPIVGRRYHCVECKDMLELCEECYLEGAEPLAHSQSHHIDVVEKYQSLEEQVAHVVDEIFADMDISTDQTVTLSEFLSWGMESEFAANVLNGFDLHYVRLCPFEESVTVTEEVYHQDPEVGRIDLEEMGGDAPATSAQPAAMNVTFPILPR